MAQEDRKYFWTRTNDVEQKWIIDFVDDNVLAKLPAGTEVTGTYPHGSSYWTRTAEIQSRTDNDKETSYFLKVAYGETGKAMVAGEFCSMTAMHKALPNSCPEPISWGTYASNTSIHFFLCHFVEMIDEVPDIDQFTSTVAELHQNTTSPTGKYGFVTPTYMGQMAQHTTWTDTWEEFFSISMERLKDQIENSWGLDQELSDLFGLIVTKVIPRLLRPLETGGRQIKPCLVHGNLYSGNVSVSTDDGRPILYDATCLYAHNEWDLAPWRLARHKIGRPFMKAYFKKCPISAPAEDQEDRSILYCLRWDLKGMVIYPGDARYRAYCIDAMKLLTERFPDGYEGWRVQQQE